MKKTQYFLVIPLLSAITLNAFSLKSGFKYALENDIDSKVNENNLKNIKFDQEIADSLFYPKVDFSATLDTSKLTKDQLTPGDDPSIKNDEYKFKITQPVFDGFESKYEKELQENRFKSAIYYLKESQGKVALDYTSAYINTLREKDLLNLNLESLAISEKIFNKVYKKVEAGYGTKLEFNTSKGDLAESRVKVDVQRINFRDTLENLKFYVQTDFDSSELRKPNFFVQIPKTLDDAIALAFENNPSINVAKLNVNVAVSQEQKKNKDFYPDLNFVATYTLNNALYAEDDSETNKYKLGLELNYNLYNGGKDSAESKKALQNIKEKQFLIKKNEYQVKNKVRLAWNSYKLNREKKESLEQYLIVKKDILDSTLKEFDLGLKNFETLHEKHIEYIDVKKDLISNSYDLLLAEYRILDATGQLSDALLDNLPTLKDVDTSEVLNSLHNDTQYSFNVHKDMENKGLKVLTPKASQSYSTHKIPEVKKVVLLDTLEKKEESLNLENYNSSFKEKFLSASKNKYTINLALSGSEKKAQALLDRYDLNEDAFYFSFRKVNPLQRIVMGVYNSKQEAKEVLDSLHKNLKRNKPIIERISKKQKTYFKYHSKNDLVVKNKFESKPSKKVVSKKSYSVVRSSFSNIQKPTIKLKKIKKQNLDLRGYKTFKDKFLNASKDKYTINLAYSDSKIKAQKLLDKYKLSDEGFVFQFRNEKPLQRIVYGVFDSKEQAKKVLASLPKSLKKNRPLVEKITKKQNTFHKYNSYTFDSSRVGSI